MKNSKKVVKKDKAFDDDNLKSTSNEKSNILPVDADNYKGPSKYCLVETVWKKHFREEYVPTNQTDQKGNTLYVKLSKRFNVAPVGMLVAEKICWTDSEKGEWDGEIIVSWSRCHVSKEKFDKKRAREVAFGRLRSFVEHENKGHPYISKPLPSSFVDEVAMFVKRAKKFFQIESVYVIGEIELAIQEETEKKKLEAIQFMTDHG
jgi:hypothetical protein